MLFMLLTILDVLSVAVLVLQTMIPVQIVLALGLLLLIKGFVFAIGGDKVSWIDVLAGLYLTSMAFGFSYWLLTFIFVIYLIQKIVTSFFI